ncbi:hypothetical protein Tco_1558622, partial [Tanacetum coccineum]
MSKGNGTGERKQTWNKFVPLAVQTRTGYNPVNTAKATSTNNFSTARQNINKQTVLTSTALKVNTIKPIVNGVRLANVFHKTHSPSSRPFKRTTDNPHRTLKNKGIDYDEVFAPVARLEAIRIFLAFASYMGD